MAQGAPAPEAFKADAAASADVSRDMKSGRSFGGLLAIPVPTPTWSWDASGTRLTITWGASGFLYLIQRDPAGPKLLTATPVEAGGRMRSVYTVEGHAPLDLYEVGEAVSDPRALPPEGPFHGFRARIPFPAK